MTTVPAALSRAETHEPHKNGEEMDEAAAIDWGDAPGRLVRGGTIDETHGDAPGRLRDDDATDSIEKSDAEAAEEALA